MNKKLSKAYCRPLPLMLAMCVALAACGGSEQAVTAQSPKHLAGAPIKGELLDIAGLRAYYQIAAGANGFAVVDRRGVDSARTVAADARLRFFDKSVAFDTAGVAGKIYRLYQAAFNRTPDSAGLGFWIAQMDRGASLTDIANGFVSSAEFKNMYGSDPTNRQLIEKYYQNVLGRASDAGGAAYWIDILDRKADTPAGVLTGFSESAENVKLVSSAIANGIEYAEYEHTYFTDVAAKARAAILKEQPVEANPITIGYQFEDGVPNENKQLIEQSANAFASRFSSILKYSNAPIGIVAYSTLAGGEALAKKWDPASAAFQNDMTATFPRQINPASVDCLGIGGFSVGYERLIVMAAPCFNSRGTAVTPHELTHEVQSNVSHGDNAVNLVPKWFAEGQANVVGPVMALLNGADNYTAERNEIVARIPANRTIAHLIAMEGETRNSADGSVILSEYTVGAAMTEYLIARSGFKKSLALLTQSNILSKGANKNTAEMMVNFRSAFQTVYGQSVDEFYAEVLPYVNFLGARYLTPEYYNDSTTTNEMGTKILLDFSCFAVGYTANLQQQVAGKWVDIASAKGWNDVTKDAMCKGRPGASYRPWTTAEIAKGSVLRWHVYLPTDDWYSATYSY